MKDLTNEQISSIWHAQAASGGRSFYDIIRAAIKADRELNGRTGEAIGEVVLEDMGVPGSDARAVRFHMYKEVPPIGSKLYTTPPAQPAREWVEVVRSVLEECDVPKAYQHAIIDKLREKNAGLPAAVPDGYALVPVEPTQEMINAAMRECSGIGGGSCGEHTGVDGDDMRSVFCAMLSAAPKPQEAGQ